jgi:hypothetical protein
LAITAFSEDCDYDLIFKTLSSTQSFYSCCLLRRFWRSPLSAKTAIMTCFLTTRQALNLFIPPPFAAASLVCDDLLRSAEPVTVARLFLVGQEGSRTF